MSVWTIVVAAGGGTRFGGAKQFAPLGAGSVLDQSVVVLPADGEWNAPDGVRTVPGGATRAESVRAGLAVVPPDATVILVHDAARPLASRALYGAVVGAIEAGADAAVPGIAVADTLKRVEGALVTGTVDRDGVVAVQTPQGFRADVLRAAHATAPEATDDAGVVEAAGGLVVVVPGEAINAKITTPDDLWIAARHLEAERS